MPGLDPEAGRVHRDRAEVAAHELPAVPADLAVVHVLVVFAGHLDDKREPGYEDQQGSPDEDGRSKRRVSLSHRSHTPQRSSASLSCPNHTAGVAKIPC